MQTVTSSLVRKKGSISFEGFPGDHVFNFDISWKRGYFVEASSGVEFFSVDLEKEDCIIVENIGVESVKVCLLANSLSDPPSADALRLGWRLGVGNFPKEDPSNSRGGFGSEPGGLGIQLGKIRG